MKRGEDLYSLLPMILSAGIGKDHIITSPSIHTGDLTCKAIFNVYDPFLNRGQIPPFTSNAAHLPLKDIADTLSFTSILQNAAKLPDPDSSVILILDSKAITRRDFVTRLKVVLEKDSWECLSLAHTPATLPEDGSWFADSQLFEQEPMTPITSGALALRLSFVKKLVKTILPFREPLDYELMFQALLHKTQAQYVFPPIFDCR